MSLSQARKKRTALYLSVAGLLLMVTAISALSARDPDGVTLRIGMVLITVGAAMWLPWQALLPAAIAVWLGPNIGRNLMQDHGLFDTNMLLELPSLIGLAAFASLARAALRQLEEQHLLVGLQGEGMAVDPQTGVYDESQLIISIEAELSRSRRFGRTFALVLVGIDELRQRFDYRDGASWQASFAATAQLLRGTRHNVDTVYRYGADGFALILPESGPRDVNGLVRRLRRVARKAQPAEGEPGGPLPAYFGATFYPTCATSTDDLLRRAEIALRIADKNANRVQIDGAEAPEIAPVEMLRQPGVLDEDDLQYDDPEVVVTAPALVLSSAPAPDDAIEVDEEPPVEVYALQAPEPSVEEYAASWLSEAPLSVLPKPHPRPLLVALEGGGAAKDPLDGTVEDTLKRLDETLNLIRSLKQRSA